MYEPVNESPSQILKVWDWDRNTKITTNRFAVNMKKFNQFIYFVSAKQLLEPVQFGKGN